MTAPCELCELEVKHPDYVVRRTDSWTLAHVNRFFPVGSLYLIHRRHLLLAEVGDELAEGAPLLTAAVRLMTEQFGAQRVYVMHFGEGYEHFHFLLFPRTPETVAAGGGLIGPRLVAAFAARDQSPPADQAAAAAARYRQAWGHV